MSTKPLSRELLRRVLRAQQNEMTEYHIYTRLARRIKDPGNRALLQEIAKDELRHCHFWGNVTGQTVKPRRFKVGFFYWVSVFFGLTFGIKLMEKGEERAQLNYAEIEAAVPGARQIIEDEDQHEKKLISLINEEILNYIGSIVLGLNDALVELTGALAGLTFALQNTKLILLAGLITGIAAAFSMAASEYLSNKAEGVLTRKALKSSLYTGIAYIITVALLVLPYLLLPNYFLALGVTFGIAILIIFIFNYYLAVARDYNFKKRFLEMTLISLGVALLSFVLGWLIRKGLGIDI